MESGGVEIRGGAPLIFYALDSAPDVPDAPLSKTAGPSILHDSVVPDAPLSKTDGPMNLQAGLQSMLP